MSRSLIISSRQTLRSRRIIYAFKITKRRKLTSSLALTTGVQQLQWFTSNADIETIFKHSSTTGDVTQWIGQQCGWHLSSSSWRFQLNPRVTRCLESSWYQLKDYYLSRAWSCLFIKLVNINDFRNNFPFHVYIRFPVSLLRGRHI